MNAQSRSASVSGIAEFYVRCDSAAEAIDQLLIHVSVIVRDMEAHHSLPDQTLGEFLLESEQVPLLHYEDQLCPADVPRRDSDPCSLLGSDRSDAVPRRTVEDTLGGQTPNAVPTADKEDVQIEERMRPRSECMRRRLLKDYR